MRGRENGDEHDGRGGRDARVPWAKRHVWVWSAGATQRSGARTELSFFVPLQCGPATGYSITAFDIWTGRLETSSLDIEFNGVYPFQATDAVGNRSAGAAFGAQRRCASLGLGGLQPPCQLAVRRLPQIRPARRAHSGECDRSVLGRPRSGFTGAESREAVHGYELLGPCPLASFNRFSWTRRLRSMGCVGHDYGCTEPFSVRSSVR